MSSTAAEIRRRHAGSSRLALGCMRLTDFYHPAVARDEATEVLRAALDAGIEPLDTAGIYEGNESLLGAFLESLDRDRLPLVSTKVGQRRDPTDPSRRILACRPDELRRDLEESNRQLGTAPAIAFLHRTDPAIPVADSVGALCDAAADGLAGSVGVCDLTPADLAAAAESPSVQFAQYEVSLFEERSESRAEACDRAGVQLLAYCPLARGLLAPGSSVWRGLEGDDYRSGLTRLTGSEAEWNKETVIRIRDEVAAPNGISLPQLALAWVRSLGPGCTPLVGARSVAQLADLVKAPETLSGDDLAAIARILRERPPAGLGRRAQSRILDA